MELQMRKLKKVQYFHRLNDYLCDHNEPFVVIIISLREPFSTRVVLTNFN